MRILAVIASICLLSISISATGVSAGAGYVGQITSFVDNFENSENFAGLTAKITHIDSLTIDRGATKFLMRNGTITFIDFGMPQPVAMVFEGDGIFSYTPPNKSEQFSINKFLGHDNIETPCDRLVIYFTSPPPEITNVYGLTEGPIPESIQSKLNDSRDDALKHLLIQLSARLADGLLAGPERTYLYADIDYHGRNHQVYREDPAHDDYCRLYEITRSAGVKTADVITGYSPNDLLPSERGIMPFDIYHYDISTRIEADGDMTVDCRVYFVSLEDSLKALSFTWYENKDTILATGASGDSLLCIQRRDDFDMLNLAVEGFCKTIVLNSPLAAGESSFVDISYDSDCLEKQGTLYFIKDQASWYPRNAFHDRSTYNLSFDCPDKYEVISCGHNVDDSEINGRHKQRFELEYPTNYASFNVGSFRRKEITTDNFPPVEIYLATELADMSMEGSDAVVVGDRLGTAGADVMNSLAMLTSILGPCPFDTVKAASIPYSYGQGSPGLVYLSWITFLDEDMEGYEESFRAHEVAHQWWGHIVDNESYRDTWIIEGLAEYCGLWFYELSGKDKGAYNHMLKTYRDYIKGGTGIGSKGMSAGPITLGYRLNSTKSDDYLSQVYYKGAYIFHMIRYLLHDYKTGSDDKFAFFLKDLLVKYDNKPITTEDLQHLLENHVGGDMTWFFDQWVYGMYFPEYKIKTSVDEPIDYKYKITLTVEQYNVPPDFKMLVPVTVLFNDDKYINFKVWVDKPITDIPLPLLPYKPKKVIFNSFDAVLCKVSQ